MWLIYCTTPTAALRVAGRRGISKGHANLCLKTVTQRPDHVA